MGRRRIRCGYVLTPFMKLDSHVPMIANVNEKGRQTKLLAAIAVLAMVVCALAVVMPSEETGATRRLEQPYNQMLLHRNSQQQAAML